MRLLSPRLLFVCVFALAAGAAATAPGLDHEQQARERAAEFYEGQRTGDGASSFAVPNEAGQGEVVPHPIELGAPLNRSDMEISGLAWHGDTLVVLPEVLPRAEEGDAGLLYGLSRASLEEAVKGSAAPVEPFPIPLEGAPVIGLARAEAGSRTETPKGFEAITFGSGQAYFAVELEREDASMTSVLLRGAVAPGLTKIRLDLSARPRLPMQAALPNMSYEALALRADTVLAFFETNGARVNSSPAVQRYDAALSPLEAVPFPALEYRLTDATALDEDGRFWVINYLYPGERSLLNPGTDSLALRFAPGATHRSAEGVERLVEYRYTSDGVRRTNSPPLYFKLRDGQWRNWEGLVRFTGGFLVATDRYPSAILAYVPTAPCGVTGAE